MSFFLSVHCIKQIDSMLPWVCSVIDHRGRQNVIKTSVTHSPAARVPRLCFYHILKSSVILNRRTATWNLLVKLPSFKDDSGATDFDADLLMI